MIVDPVVEVFFAIDATGAPFFTLDDPIKGELDGVTYLLADTDITSPTDVSDRAYTVRIRRGRSRELDEITTGTCTVEFRNYDRVFDPNYAAGPYFGLLRPGKRMRVSVYGVTIFDGNIDEWPQSWSYTKEALAAATAIDSLGRLARRDFDEWTTTGGQTAGPRITAVLDRVEVAWGANRNLDTGISTLQADLVTHGSNVLNYLQLVAKSDFGRLFADRNNVLTFRDRHSLITGAVVADFADDDTAIGFSKISPSSGSDLFYNRVSVDREGGVKQTATDTAAGIADDIRSLNIGGLLLNTDAQSLDMANYLLNIYREPEVRIASLEIRVSGLSENDQVVVAGIDLGDVVNVRWTPGGIGAELDEMLVVEGVEHEMGVGQIHTMRLALSNTVDREALILDDTFFGVLDVNRLGF